MKKKDLFFAPPALALCVLYGYWIWWIPSLGLRGAFGEFVLTLFCTELWCAPLVVHLAFATYLFVHGWRIWRRDSSWRSHLFEIALGYSPIALFAMLPLFQYAGP